MFVREYHRPSDSSHQSARDLLRATCTVSLDTVAVAKSPRLHLPSAIAGVECFVTFSFRNTTGVSLANGWLVRLTLSPSSCNNRQHCLTKTCDGNTLAMNAMGRCTNEKCIAIEEMECPLDVVQPGEKKAMSFPIVITSHSPIYVSIALRFQHSSETLVQNSNHDLLDVQVSLCENLSLDILCMSAVTEKPGEHDSSHEQLPSSSMVRLLNANEERCEMIVQPLAQRFAVPVVPSLVRSILGLNDGMTHFKSLLGAVYSVSVGEMFESTKKSNQVYGCIVTIRGAPHVLPFVRAGILRKLLNDDNNNVQWPELVVSGRDKLERWRRSNIDCADECHGVVAEAERLVCEASKTLKEVEDNVSEVERCVSLCSGEMKRALLGGQEAYAKWRRANEQVWSALGVCLSRGG